jgi:class 3 adenylate cyclase
MSARVRLTGEMLVETQQGTARAADFPGRQGRLAFARLALSPSPVERAQLAEVVWPDRLPRSWERDLSAVVSKVRALLISIGLEDPVRQAMGCYQLRLGADVSVDVLDAMRFAEDAEAALARGDVRAAHSAIAVAHEHCLRPFLPGEDGPWIDGRRAERRELLIRVLDTIVAVDTRRGVFPEGRRMALQLIELEPYRESSYASLMRLQVAAGDRADALKTYERARTLLVDELGVSPGATLESAYQEALFADAPADTLPSGTVTLLFTDLVASTELAGRLGAEQAEVMRREHFSLLRELVAMHAGHEVKSLGDGLMVVFASAGDAVACAIAIDKAVSRKSSESVPLAVRIGVHTGEPVLEDGDYFGLSVVIAKRLCDAIDDGGILVSDAVRALTTEIPANDRVELTLKGFTDSIGAWPITRRNA